MRTSFLQCIVAAIITACSYTYCHIDQRDGCSFKFNVAHTTILHAGTYILAKLSIETLITVINMQTHNVAISNCHSELKALYII